ncbi:MAG TPA: thiolase family protein [Candidatus Poseidoniales archaeon]|jgi:acetyl-CoA acyltransferase|nr:MAG: acetyl-CoA C-acyltransferase [Euryarchaeota archaeon]HIM64166.1 thiolase family protein [Candidatus Poseidoniales archaeon]
MPAVIVGYARSPFTPAKRGALARTRPDDIAAAVVNQIISDVGVDPSLVDDLIVGCAFPEAEQGYNLGRIVVFLTELPETVPGVTINRFCGSSMQSIHDAAARIEMGMGDAFIAGGVESMSRVPMTGFNPMPNTRLEEESMTSMGITAENLSGLHSISREDQEAFAIESQARAAAARESGAFADEIVAIETTDGTVQEDGCIRPGTNAEALAKLRPAFDANGTVTAGTSSPLTDGAAFVFVCSEEFAAEHGLKPMARIKSAAVSGCAPEIMGIGPVSASRKALERAGLSLDDIDLIELNEAFAAQSLAVIGELGLDRDKVNIEGGAIALGHPLGASGARITGKAAQLMQKNGAKHALATLCVGGGMGMATVLERV